MLNRTFTVLQKIKHRGWGWFKQRLILEFRIPETTLGKILKPLNQKIIQATRFLNSDVLLGILLGRKKVKNTLYLFYDLEVSPITYNFCWALAIADRKRKDLGLSHLAVVFVPGPKQGLREEMVDYEKVVTLDERIWRFHNLLIPLTRLIPACNNVFVCQTRLEAFQIFKTKVQHFYPNDYDPAFPTCYSPNEGIRTENILGLQSSERAKTYVEQWLQARAKNRKVIVVTIRSYGYMPARNSNIEAWSNFLAGLDPSEYFPVIVPDTVHALDKPDPRLAAFEHCVLASFNVDIRAALYELCYLNMGVNNGPLGICWLMENCRYLMFKCITESVPQTTADVMKEIGFEPGKNPVFAKKFQEWVWQDDTLDVLNAEFRKICAKIDGNIKIDGTIKIDESTKNDRSTKNDGAIPQRPCVNDNVAERRPHYQNQ